MTLPSEWAARFITSSLYPSGAEGAPAPYLRREFEVAGGLRRATLRLTALGLIEAHLNGRRVGDQVLVPGWTSYAHRLVVSSHDVTRLLRPGRNALGAVLGDGWACGRLGWDPANRNRWADRPAGLLQLELEYEDRVEVIASDESWRASTGALQANGIYDGEEHDARLEPAGWTEAGFDDSAWHPVDIVERDLSKLIEPQAPPIRRTEEIPAVDVLTTPSGRTVVDFGQNLVGWVRLRIEAERGTRIVLHHCELMVAGEPDYETNRSARAEDVYTCRGDGVETWEPRFTFHGFRYVEVRGWQGELSPDSLTAVVVHSDMDRTGWFETSDDLLNRLHRNAVWSMRGNFVGVPTDCPQRDERLGWTGDINAFAPAAAFLYDVSGVLGSWLQDLMAEQLAGGFVPMVVPNVLDRLAPPTALWADVAVSLPWLLYQEYGDLSVLERQYPSMVALMDSVEPLLDDGLWLRGFQFGDWLDPDAPPKSPGRAKTRPEVVASAYLCRTTRELASTAELLGRAADAARFDDLHARVRSAFRREWVTEAGLLVNETATAYALAICFGILEPDQEERAGRRLAQVVADSGYKISTGFAGTPFVMPALTRTGHIETAYRLLLQTEAPSFLYPVTMGATTIWERWDAVKPDGTLNSTGMTSLNHYALGAVVDWLHRVVGGLDRKAPGYRELRIAPQPGGGLRHVTTRRRTPFGEARVGWRRGEGRLELEVVVPPGSTAEVVLPLHPEGRVERVEAGEHRWSYEVPPDAPRAYTLDTSLRELASVPDAWEALRLVLLARVPESVVDSLPRLWPDSSPRQLLAQVPGPVEGLEEEMAAALARAT